MQPPREELLAPLTYPGRVFGLDSGKYSMKSWPGSSAVVLAQFLSTQQHLLGKPAFSPQVVHFPVEPRISAKDPQSFMRISANDPQSFYVNLCG